MFRFSIRELVLVTLVVALGIGWGLERWQNSTLARRLVLAENESQLMQTAVTSLHEDIAGIEKGLTPYGLKLVWSREMRPTLEKAPRKVAE